MAVNEGVVLTDVLSKDEYEKIPDNIRSKIENFLSDNVQEYLTAKAVYEISKLNSEEKIKNLSDELTATKKDRDAVLNKLNFLQDEFNELKEKYASAGSELSKCQEKVKRLEVENSKFRQERNLAVDDREEALQMIARRDALLKRLQDDVKDISAQLEAAIRAKCVAIAKNDDIEGRKMELDHKEKMLNKEKQLLLERINALTCDIAKHSTDLTNLRRENTANMLVVQGQLGEKTEELRQSLTTNAQLTETIESLKSRVETLTQKLIEQREIETKLNEDYQEEIKAQTKLADLYKGLSEDAANKNAELTMAVKELQKLLQDASQQYGNLETKLKEEEANHKAVLDKKNKCIGSLKKELEHANELVHVAKQEKEDNLVGSLSPAAAAAGRLIKSGLTMTQIYSLYAQVSEELILEKAQTKKLNLYIDTILKEIEQKAPILKKQRDDYDYAINTVETLTARVEEMESECSKLRHSSHEAEKKANHLDRENKRLTGTVNDLSRQVCFLLKEVEESRGVAFPLSCSPEPLAADLKTSADVIAKHLVTFRNVQELQATNQKMLAVIRELSSKQEQDDEDKENAKVKEMEEQLNVMKRSYEEMLENDKQVRKALEMVKKQRDLLRMLFNQQVRGDNILGDTPMEVEDESCVVIEGCNLSSPKKITEQSPVNVNSDQVGVLERKLQDKEAALASLRSEFDDYRKEKSINEKMLNDELDRYRSDIMKKIKQISDLAGKLEFIQQTNKTLQTNANIHKTQISSLESKINNYMMIVAKHEQSIVMLRDEALNASSKLARAEVALESLKQEHQLLKESEARLIKERDMLLRGQRGQDVLLANLEFIKTTMERTENEGKLRLEMRLDESSKECTALRHRLQDEQDRFRERMELLEKQALLAKQRQEEEVKLASDVRAELEENKRLLKEKQELIDSLSQKMREIKHTIIPDPTTEERVKCLEEQLNQKGLEVESLHQQLTLSKKNMEEFRDMALLTEKQLSEVTGAFNRYKEESFSKVKSMEDKEKELTSTVSKLKEEVRTLTTNKEEAMSSLRELMNVQKKELIETKDELAKNKQKLDSTFEQLKNLQEAYDNIDKKFTAVVAENTDMQKELNRFKEEIETLREDYKKIEIEKDKAIEALNSGERNWGSLEVNLRDQIKQLQDRLDRINLQNDVLHEQLETFGLKLSIAQPKESTSADLSLTEEQIQGTDQLMQLVKYLRDEKNHAVSQHEAFSQENLNLKAKVEVLSQQLEEVCHTLAEERSKEGTDKVTFAKHTELMKKVETLNAITEENSMLQEETKKKDLRITELEQQMEKIENQVVRENQERITKLLEQISQLSTENTSLKNESARWKQRSNALLERTNKNSPEDFKRLIMEKENLQKQLNTEKEQVKSFRADKTKLEEQLNQLKQQLQSTNEELSTLKNHMVQIGQQLNEAKEDNKQKAEQVSKLTLNISAHEKSLADIRNKEMKVRQIAKKYKTRYEEMCRIEESKESTSGEVSDETQERLREEGRREAETSQAERLKELTDQVSTTQAEADTLRKENDLLKASSADKEERAKGLLKNARHRIMQLTEEKAKTTKDLTEIRNRVSLLENTKEKLEKDKNDIQSEFERVSKDNELLNQRLNIMQRQLEKLQGSKPSTSSGMTEKTNIEPPTANIKPMAGPSSSGSKQQPITHSVTVTPWRGGPETPFASIRPISQSRTAAVHPTTNQSSNTQGQAVLVPPQQQMVHTSTGVAEVLSSSPTSSHTDYMPATSSAMNIRQATVPPTQSTQDVDNDTEIQQQNQSSSTPTQAVSIALVLPQPTAQTSSSQTTQTQVVSAENSSVVSASNQEQSLDQSVVSASSHTPSSDQSFVSASSGHTQMCSTASSYYRQQEVDEPAGQSEQSVVASSQQQLVEQSVTVSSQQPGPSEQGMSDQSVASSQHSDQSVASSHHGGVSDQSVASSRQDQSVASSQLVMSDQSVASSRQTQAEQSIAVASSQTSMSSNTVTTTQSAPGPSLKRPRDGSAPNEEGESTKTTPPIKRSRAAMSGGEGGEMLLRADGLEVEYQVPTSSQRDQEDDIILVDTTDEEEEDDDEGMPDDGDMAMTSFEVGEGPDIDENITDQDNNEVEIIEDSNEVPNQSESSSSGPVEGAGGGLSEATSSGHSNVTSNQNSPGHFARRASAIPPLNRQQQQQLLLPQSYEEAGDDSIVPSTPTLFVPRRTDGFGEAVSSPHVPSGRFTFSDNNTIPSTRAGVAQVASEGMDDTRMDLSQLEDAGTGRSVPTTPLQVSPQELVQGEVGQSSSDEQPMGHISENIIPNVTVTVSHDVMPPPADGDAEIDQPHEGRLMEGSVEVMEEPELASLDLPEEGGDGVSSEGEKSQLVVEDIEEGREAEASEAGPSRSSGLTRGSGTARRSHRQMVARNRARPPPQRITWEEDNSPSQRGTGQFRVRAPTPTRGGVTDASRGGTAFRSRARRMRNYHSSFPTRF